LAGDRRPTLEFFNQHSGLWLLGLALAPSGAKLAHATDARRLRQVFAVFLARTALRMFYGLLH
jgi:uncharacterized membrane protein YfcA